MANGKKCFRPLIGVIISKPILKKWRKKHDSFRPLIGVIISKLTNKNMRTRQQSVSVPLSGLSFLNAQGNFYIEVTGQVSVPLSGLSFLNQKGSD